MPILLDEIDRIGAGLVALGSHGRRRATEILVGGVAGELLHKAPCSVLIARPAPADAWPRAVVVGFDGSAHSVRALAVARRLAERDGLGVRIVTAHRGKRVDLERVHRLAPASREVDAHPVAALVEGTSSADLIVVGSRGLHGVRALGSVSERVAHRAPCSVLVVREGAAAPSKEVTR